MFFHCYACMHSFPTADHFSLVSMHINCQQPPIKKPGSFRRNTFIEVQFACMRPRGTECKGKITDVQSGQRLLAEVQRDRDKERHRELRLQSILSVQVIQVRTTAS